MTQRTQPKSRFSRISVWLGIPLGLVVIWMATPSESSFKQSATWQQLAEPGDLSAAHAHLENNCSACHSPVTGVPAAKCVVCHANNESLLQRQPTAFHAHVDSCTECHLEHEGVGHRPTNMNHDALAQIGLRQLGQGTEEHEATRLNIEAQINNGRHSQTHVTPREATLNCVSCHGSSDRHFGLFGNDCAQCHAVDRWSIPQFRHPSVTSKDCAQCHQAPPSHYMMHFKMISARVAGRPHARVDQCFECHQTTSWNDIRGAGWYKHH